MTYPPRLAPLAAALLAVSLAGCHNYVRHAVYDPEVAALHEADRRNAREIESVKQELARMARDLAARLKGYDGAIAELRGRVRVDTTAHFAYDDATLREPDKAVLSEFAKAIREHHPNILVTIEGFADPAGDAAYNRDLGQRRADAVRRHLIAEGLPPDTVRAVSYGEDRNRQVQPGAWGEDGLWNRRATLVVDYVANSGTLGASR